jgi:hypothetical protein
LAWATRIEIQSCDESQHSKVAAQAGNRGGRVGLVRQPQEKTALVSKKIKD